MGRASRTKRVLREAKARREAITAGSCRVAGAACSSCAFFDPTALEDDLDLVWKLADALKRDKRFVCHDGFPQNARGAFIPSDEQMAKAPLCAGFAAVRREMQARGLLEGNRNLVRLEAALAIQLARQTGLHER